MKHLTPVTVRLIVRTYDAAGRQLTEECKDNDIFLYNWATLIANWIKAAFCASLTGTYPWKNLEGVDKTTQQGEFSGSCRTGDGAVSADIRDTGFVQVGSDPTPPQISDYKLGTFIAEATPTPPAIYVVGQVIKIVFTTTFAMAQETTIAETGIRMCGCISRDLTAAGKFLITRDTFTPATVPANGTVSVQHELWFNGTP